MSWWGRTVNRFSDSVKKFTADRGRLSQFLTSGGTSEINRGLEQTSPEFARINKYLKKGDLHSQINELDRSLILKNLNKTPAPGPSDMSGQEAAQRLISDQINTAEEFEKQLPGYIEGEYGDRARDIKEGSKESLGALRSNLNARGMLHSGLRQGKEGKLATKTAGLLNEARADTVRDAVMRNQAMKVNAGLSAQDNLNKQQEQLANLDAIKAQRDAFRSQMMGNAFGSIGSGVGQYYGSK